MNISGLLSIASLALTLGAAFFLARGSFGLAPEHIAELGATKWNYNLDAIRSLAEEKAHSLAGMWLLLLAFALQLVDGFVPTPGRPEAYSPAAVVVGLGSSAVVFILVRFAAIRSSERHTDRAVELLKKKEEAS